MKNLNPIKEFSFDRIFEGIVINNDKYEETNEVDIILKDITMTDVEDGMEYQESIRMKNVINSSEFHINNKVTNTNYITCKPLLHNVDDLLVSRPEIGDRVVVEFYNGNPKLPYYRNKYLPYDVVNNPPKGFLPKFDGIENNYYRIIRLRSDGYMTGSDIDTLGEQLYNLGYNVKDNKGKYQFDNNMMNEVMKFQNDHGLRADGIVDPITFTEIIQESRNKGFC